MNWPTRSCRQAAVALLSSALLLTACEDPNTVGLELPGTSSLTTEFTDLPVTASTIQLDSVPTAGRNNYLVGRLPDTNLGTITARAFFETQISTDSIPALFTNAQLDSVVLYYSYDYVYGPTTQAPRFDVYKLAAPLDERTTYSSSSSLPVVKPALASNVAGNLNRTQLVRQRVTPASTTDTTTKLVPVPVKVLRLPVVRSGQASAFGTALFAALNTPGFNQASLNAVLPGFSLQPAESYSGSLVRFNRSASTKAVVYYRAGKTKEPTVPIRRSYTINYSNPFANRSNGQPDPNAPRFFTQITTELAGPLAQLRQESDSVRSSLTSGLTYIQEGTGLATKLVIPGLQELAKQDQLLINRAELIIPVKPYANVLFAYPPQAFLYEANRANRILQRTVNGDVVDRVVQASGFSPTASGSAAIVQFSDVSGTNKYYSVLLTSYVQAYISNTLGTKPSGFIFTPSPRLLSTLLTSTTDNEAVQALARSNNLTLNRAALDADNIKLRVYYSRL